jgi:DNA-binding FadR family transcriptional regulator
MRKYNSKTILVPGRDEQSLKEHQAIYEALKKRDPALAEQCIRTHMQNVRKTFEEYYSLLF